MNHSSDIYSRQVPNLVNKLIAFVGRSELNRCLERYRRSLDVSGPVTREYYLRSRHPWWDAMLEYFALERTGKSVKRHLTDRIKTLAGDAKRISILQSHMPPEIRAQYRKRLIDDNNAHACLFEIHIAWHFYLKRCQLEWYTSNSTPHGEFLVRSPGLEFDVECKRISVDIARRVRRKDFYRLVEVLLPAVRRKGYAGSIDIVLTNRLSSSQECISQLSAQVVSTIEDEGLKGRYDIPLGSVNLRLDRASGNVVDWNECVRGLLERKPPEAEGAVFVESKHQRPADPVELTVMSIETDNVLRQIRRRLAGAARRQLDSSKPGLICCFLEGIDDLTGLASESGLQVMTCSLLDQEELKHVAAISYCSEARTDAYTRMEEYYNQALLFRNPNCRFEKARQYAFTGTCKPK